jgi:polar amino acid transport system permease protein
VLASAVKVFSNGQNFLRLLEGLWMTLKLSAAAVSLSLFFGFIVGLLMLSSRKTVRTSTRFYLETIRIVPVLTFLFLFYYLLSRTFKINLESVTVVLLTFTLWGTAEIADLVRGAFTSIPRHQKESGLAVGLTDLQVQLHIIAPQAARRLAPGVVNLVTRMIKTTSLVFFIGIPELVTVSQQVVEVAAYQHNRPAAFWIYGLVFLFYFIVCWPISKISKSLEKRCLY